MLVSSHSFLFLLNFFFHCEQGSEQSIVALLIPQMTICCGDVCWLAFMFMFLSQHHYTS